MGVSFTVGISRAAPHVPMVGRRQGVSMAADSDQAHRDRLGSAVAAELARPDVGAIAMDAGTGQPLPYAPAQVKSIMERAAREGELVAAIVQMPDGNMSVHLFCQPSRAILKAFEEMTRGLTVLVRGQ
jgi:hypothetical protein